MTTFGLTDQGLLIPIFEDIRTLISNRIKTAFGASVDTGDKSALGEFAAIVSEQLAALWEVIEQVAASQDPDKATAAALDAISALTGTFRPAASKSAVILTLTGTPTTLVVSGSLASTVSTSKSFATRADATIVAAAAWAISTAYVLGGRVTHGANVYQCSQSGTSAGAGGPTGTSTGISDGSAKWDFVGVGTGVVDVSAACTETGPIAAAARDISVKGSPTSGWQTVVNLNDANAGRDEASDQELRLLREEELANDGTGTADAILAALLKVAGVTSVSVFPNNTDVTDAAGVPPHAVECMVQQLDPGFSADQAIRDCIFANVAAGIATHGAVTGTSTDSQGVTHEIDFSRPTAVPIYVAFTVIKDPELYPADGDAQIKSAVAAIGTMKGSGNGKDAVASLISAQAFKVSGVIDVVSCFIATTPSPTTSVTVSIDTRHLATYDTSRVTVSSSSGTP